MKKVLILVGIIFPLIIGNATSVQQNTQLLIVEDELSDRFVVGTDMYWVKEVRNLTNSGFKDVYDHYENSVMWTIEGNEAKVRKSNSINTNNDTYIGISLEFTVTENSVKFEFPAKYLSDNYDIEKSGVFYDYYVKNETVGHFEMGYGPYLVTKSTDWHNANIQLDGLGIGQSFVFMLFIQDIHTEIYMQEFIVGDLVVSGISSDQFQIPTEIEHTTTTISDDESINATANDERITTSENTTIIEPLPRDSDNIIILGIIISLGSLVFILFKVRPSQPVMAKKIDDINLDKTVSKEIVVCGTCGERNHISHTFCIECGSSL